MAENITVKGAREHNLKNIDLTIPREKLIVITGLSGSGKSSLAFDTIYAEGQRRYVESLSSYARQFLGLMEKPDVDQIDGLSPAISIDQKSTSRNPRSTVATVTEIYDYLRLLFARIGIPHCPARLPNGKICSKPVSRQTPQVIVDKIFALGKGAKLIILAPIIIDKKGEHAHVPDQFMKAGFARARVDGVIYPLDEFPKLDKQKKHTIELVVDRVINDADSSGRITQSVEQALELADGIVKVQDATNEKEYLYSQHYACMDHPDVAIPELAPRTFSFNSPHGACPVCTGLGNRLEVDPNLVIPNGNLTIAEGAIRPWNTLRVDSWYYKIIKTVAQKNDISLHIPTGSLSKDKLDIILYGTGQEQHEIMLGSGRSYHTTFEGIIPNLERRHKETESDFVRREIEKYMREIPCHECGGRRLKPESLAVTINNMSIMDICDLAINDAADFFESLKLSEKELIIAKQILKEIKARIRFLVDVGLEYLSLSRAANTLSGGEAQRIRLATQIGSGLMGVLYVLDEPSIGLHQRDNNRLIETLKKMRDLGNTVIVVEHDEETIKTADFLVDIGPGAGEHGGYIVATGTPREVAKNQKSITAAYLNGKKSIPSPKKRRIGSGKSLTVIGANENNLNNIDVEIPLGKLVVVSGVSGSGKSSLVNEILAKELQHRLHRANVVPGRHSDIKGIENLDKVIVIDQSPIGRTPRSNPATYTGVFTAIRELFAMTPEARIRGYKAGRFSFNVRGGRCENCRGDGIIKIEMHFLPDVYVPCEVCRGERYNREALEIHYKDKNIANVLNMTVETALDFFKNIPSIQRKLQTLYDVGIGYIRLGQPATTLSGGEAQRIKLASELSRRATGKTLYILDEPTTGLHMEDVKKLLEVLHALVSAGNSMIVIEHNLDVIKSADYVIDMGPEGGDKGGNVIASGTPEEVAKEPKSFTGKYLQKIFK
ncbi:excinuclease ABC subunit UvrA [Candidatus Saccharibacteria bacterium CPR2]|nr:excinuclease ABC subunit UvrA [Candidatus Saccharibacteria bacterium CPR2]